jgi:uncharacterized protein GlcG (DUF336 family)
MRHIVLSLVLAAGISPAALAQGARAGGHCGIPAPVVAELQSKLNAVAEMDNGGIFKPSMMWSAVVDREGRLCSVAKVGDAWPGSRAIAIAKAGTANDFSNEKLALSTANLWSATQPAGSLYGLNNSNPFNPSVLPLGSGIGTVAGGIITFGGGVPLYKDGKVIGGLGLSGDSACADHVIAYRMRREAGLDKIPGGVGFNKTDNIDFLTAGEGPTGFKHPHCLPSDLAPDKI